MKIGVSSCLLGQMCRYNGGHAKDDFVMDMIDKYFDIVPYCPEAIVFGTPREAIRLFEEDEKIKVVTSNGNKDVTKELEGISLSMAQKVQKDELCGFILKSNSPTCGLERVKVYDTKNVSGHKRGIGLFAKQLKKLYPYLPIEEEGRLQDAWLRENFIMQLFAYESFEKFKENANMKNLVDFHKVNKFMLHSKNETLYRELGNIVANHEKASFDTLMKNYEFAFKKAIAQKSSKGKTRNVLEHMTGFLKKFLNAKEKEMLHEQIDDFMTQIVPLIVPLTSLKLYATKYNVEYLLEQKFLSPYPKEFALRSDIKSVK
jgi:uncharacterized protein YbgA (DUF1722 family)/uncharacterized protein YbbK (DUF523 family)